MKRTLLLILVLITSIETFAQWTIKTMEDDYTLEKYSVLIWENRKDGYRALYYPAYGSLRLGYFFAGLKYFDQTWDATLNNNGVLSSKYVEGSLRVINGDKSYKEFSDTYKMWFTSFDSAGDPFFGSIDLDMDVELLKKGAYLTARIENPFLNTYITMKISLAGFTAAYNRAKK